MALAVGPNQSMGTYIQGNAECELYATSACN